MKSDIKYQTIQTRIRNFHLIIVFTISFSFFFSLAKVTPEPVLTGNEGSHISLIYSIVYRKSFDLIFGPADASFFKGKYYSNKPPGFSLALATPYIIYNKFKGEDLPFLEKKQRIFEFLKLFNVLISSLSVVVIFILLSTFKLSTISIYIGVIASFFGTIYPAYGATATSIPLSVFLCLLSLLTAILYKREHNILFYLISTFSVSYAFIVDYANAFVLIPIVILLFRWIKDDYVLIFHSIPSLIPLLLLMIYNHLVFEKFFILSYSYYSPPDYVKWNSVSNSMSALNVPNGLYGLLISDSRGMLIISPITLIGATGLYFTIKNKLNVFLLFSISGLGIFITSFYNLWHGGHCIGYRHILIPAIILSAISSFFYEYAGKSLKIVTIIVLIFSSAIGILSFFIQSTPDLLMITWSGEPENTHAGFFLELLFPFLSNLL